MSMTIKIVISGPITNDLAAAILSLTHSIPEKYIDQVSINGRIQLRKHAGGYAPTGDLDLDVCDSCQKSIKNVPQSPKGQERLPFSKCPICGGTGYCECGG